LRKDYRRNAKRELDAVIIDGVTVRAFGGAARRASPLVIRFTGAE
jgi:hypothetical protein